MFAFNYCAQQGAKSGMALALQRCDGGIGTGKGLSGLDGAAQAGMILAAVTRLQERERNLIIATFGEVRTECHCGEMCAPKSWHEAIDALSHCPELDGAPRKARHAIICLALSRNSESAVAMARKHGLSERTVQDKAHKLKKRLLKERGAAFAQLERYFTAAGVVG